MAGGQVLEWIVPEAVWVFLYCCYPFDWGVTVFVGVGDWSTWVVNSWWAGPRGGEAESVRLTGASWLLRVRSR